MLLLLASIILGFLVLGSITTYYLYRKLTIKNLGQLPITTSSVAFDHSRYGKIITWDKHTFYIKGKPFPIISGEFHYWRLPDKQRWKDILLTYKSSGLNCIRIYFHWGYHSPQQGVYLFDGNRDVEYLMTLCEELQLFVLAAPGPYICAETQAGGHPIWLVAKRNVRIRHLVRTLYRSYDLEYSRYGKEWFEALLPILKSHQITEKTNGCLLALQIENENFEKMKSIPIGLADDMRYLCKTARDLGITVPLFTNDAWESGSFIPKREDFREFGKEHFGVDLYGFDKYVVFCPNSSPSAAMFSSGPQSPKTWGEWKTKDVEQSFGDTEKLVRGFGGGAAESPIFIAELQGGWFNHYSVGATYDDIYNYFGEMFTKMIVETAVSQGSTAFSIYMFYGGTNWGTLGDPDVYTSYGIIF